VGEIGKHAVDSWNDLLVARVGEPGAALMWTLVWASAAVLAIVFARYVGVLGAGGAAEGTPERQAYENLRVTLSQGGSPTRVYGLLLTRFLNSVDRFMGDHGEAHQRILGNAFGLRGSFPLWTGAALDRCLMLALFYPFASMFMIWAISEHIGPGEKSLGLPLGLNGWQRAAVLVMGMIAASASFLFSAASAEVVVFVLIAAIAGAGTIAGVESVAIAVAVATAISGSVAITVAFIGAGAGVIAVAVTCVGSVSVAIIVGLVGGAAAFIVGLVAVVLVGVTISFHLHYSARGYRGVFVITLDAVILFAIIAVARALATTDSWALLGPLLLFLPLMACLNAPFGWLSIGLTRALLRRGVELQG
jgi:hypothetical protein